MSKRERGRGGKGKGPPTEGEEVEDEAAKTTEEQPQGKVLWFVPDRNLLLVTVVV